MNAWPHQERGVREVIAAHEAGDRRICLTSPTGGGKSRMMVDLIEWAAKTRKPVALYTNRRMLLEQTRGVLESHGLDVGMRAAGHKPALLRDVQLCMTQSELSAVYKNKTRELHRAGLVLVDEAHVQTGGAMEQILSDHEASGATVVGVTATPLDIGHLYSRLVVAGVNSELRDCGAHVICHTYAPDEPDLKHIKKYKVGEDLTEKDASKAIMRHGVFGRVLTNWQRLNPDQRPTILFAPGVAESIYFAEQFKAAGIKAAHIDGSNVWIDGDQYPTTQALRDGIMAGSKSGDIPVVCNRFVLREGIDAPWLYHAIFATVFGALTSFLQSGGRLLRSHSSLDHVQVQDHGGNWHRHGSLNSDREWDLSYTNHMAVGLRLERIRNGSEPEPIVCSQCYAPRLSGPTCPKCGHSSSKRSRMVVQVDGSLKAKDGAIVKPRRIKQEPDTARKWEAMFHRGRSKKWNATFNQAEALFFYENHYYPPRDLPYMPKNEVDWFRRCNEVSADALIQREPAMVGG